ncbi:ABC transporter substrate-binding protein [Actinophytocola xanthii]|uniref:ABC transporter substrate-binding protein n=1 Tax=Actinophytocola xanthii TaxID=1912961 RepID=UPI001E3E9379|nr:ABC transporter substrate-binding protein [Actinophytocola xanthii]
MSEQQTKILRVGVTQEVDSLNPFISITRTGTDILRTGFDYLTVYNQEDYSPIGSLAESWETSQDKLTWTFKLRDGLKWSDGEPLTAEDPAWTFNKMLDDEVARTANGSYVKQWESVEATDEHTLVIKTKVPQATMLALDIPIVPEHVWSKVADIGAAPQFPMVGSGPYTIQEFKEAQFTKLKANPNFWRGKPKVEELHFIYYRNSDAAVTALQNGEIDLVNRLNPTQFDSLESNPDIARNKAQNRRFNEILINPGAATFDGKPIGDGNPALKDIKLRQAIATAIDSKTLVDKVWGGYAEEAQGYIPPVFGEFAWSPPEDLKREFSLDEANAMLDEAGYRKGPNGVRLDKQGKPLNLRLMTHAEANLDEVAGPFVKGWLAEIGINITLQPLSDNQVNESTTRGEFDLAFSGWNANPDPDYVLSLQTCASRPNAEGKGNTPDSFLCDEEYDELYNQQLQEFDRGKRVDLVKQMQEVLHDRATLVILGYDNALEAYRKDAFEGFPLQPREGGVIMNQQGYWGYYGATPAGEGPVPVFNDDGTASASDAETSEAADEESSNTGVVLAIVGGVILVLLVGGLLFARGRRRTADERE